MSERARIIFAGSGEFGLPSLRALIDRFDVVQVITQPDRPAGRGRTLTPTPIGAFAAERNLALLKTSNINAESLPPADVMVVIAFGQKIAPHVVDHPRLGSVNLHASLLPKYRGAAPINWAIIRGETVSGNSVIRLAEKMDAGAILAQSQVEVGELETAGELHDRLAEDGAQLVPHVVEELIAGRATETPQDESQATLAPKLSREQSKIDFTRAAHVIANEIRGMYPWPGCRVRLMDETGEETARVTLVRARATTFYYPAGSLCAASKPPPTLEPAIIARRFEPRAASRFLVGCGNQPATALDIVQLKPEGKRPMSLEAFRNGHRWEQGMRLESLA